MYDVSQSGGAGVWMAKSRKEDRSLPQASNTHSLLIVGNGKYRVLIGRRVLTGLHVVSYLPQHWCPLRVMFSDVGAAP